ncbi:hypothetical protein AVEN_164519-1 [Araneus ventricosus]|uniref:Uncharacterized protein n=1 Tax=Araneus ventricosus TaxID=182803 RepID=A0A4Y2B4D8_ARAVE|nr:hypothetical protein AVEN_164519-1 [Araneus ventricosus]
MSTKSVGTMKIKYEVHIDQESAFIVLEISVRSDVYFVGAVFSELFRHGLFCLGSYGLGYFNGIPLFCKALCPVIGDDFTTIAIPTGEARTDIESDRFTSQKLNCFPG